MNLTSPEWASTLLPARVLSTEFLGEPLRVANFILTVKKTIVKTVFRFKGFDITCLQFSLPRALSKSARNIIDIGSNLLDHEVHDQVRREVDSTLGMVADGGSSRESENIRERSADELEWVVLIAS